MRNLTTLALSMLSTLIVSSAFAHIIPCDQRGMFGGGDYSGYYGDDCCCPCPCPCPCDGGAYGAPYGGDDQGYSYYPSGAPSRQYPGGYFQSGQAPTPYSAPEGMRGMDQRFDGRDMDRRMEYRGMDQRFDGRDMDRQYRGQDRRWNNREMNERGVEGRGGDYYSPMDSRGYYDARGYDARGYDARGGYYDFRSQTGYTGPNGVGASRTGATGYYRPGVTGATGAAGATGARIYR